MDFGDFDIEADVDFGVDAKRAVSTEAVEVTIGVEAFGGREDASVDSMGFSAFSNSAWKPSSPVLSSLTRTFFTNFTRHDNMALAQAKKAL